MRKIFVFAMVLAFGLAGTAMAADGASLFKSKCGTCHGSSAQGTPGVAPKLAGSAFIKGPADAVKSTILNGRKGAEKKYSNFPLAMPAWGKMGVSDADADALVKYLKSL